MFGDDEGADEINRLELTAFPSLTGSRPSTSDHSTVSDTYTFRLALSHLHNAAQRHNETLGAAFQAAWTRILAAYTGTHDDISFFSIKPIHRDNGYICESRLVLTRYRQREHGPAIHLQDLHQTIKQISNETLDHDRASADRYKVSKLRGTLLDIGSLPDSPEASYPLEPIHHFQSKCHPAVTIKVTASPAGSLSAAVTAQSGVINVDAARLMLEQFDSLLSSFSSRQGLYYGDLNVYSKAPSRFLESQGTADSKAFSSLQSRLECTAEANPDLVAIEYYSSTESDPLHLVTSWTYRELNQKADIVALYLQSRFRHLTNQVVPICMDRGPSTYVAVLGILKTGRAWSPIDPSFPPRRRHDLVLRTGAQVLLTDSRSPLEGIPENVTPVDVNTLKVIGDNVSNIPPITPEDLAYLIWTSGTTGLPKGVPINHQAAVASMSSLQARIPTDTRNGNVRCLQFSQFTFDVFVQDLFYTWGVGGTLISADREIMLGSFANLATKAKATHAHLTPAFAASVSRESCPTLEVVTMIGEKLIQDVADDWSKNCRLYNTYGPAETTVVSTVRHVPCGDPKLSVNVGYPLPTVSAFVIQDGALVIKNGIGELALGGPQLSTGYWKDPAKTAERFVWNEFLQTTLYMTGDLVRQLHDGSFEFIGRTDDLVKIQGIRIELSEIAFALRYCHTDVRQVEVLFIERPDRPSKVLVAFLALPGAENPRCGKKCGQKSIEVARSALQVAKDELPDYMIPKVFLALPALPRTSSAKIDQNALKELYAETDLGAWERQLGLTEGDACVSENLDPREGMIMNSISKLTGTASKAMSRQSALPCIGVDSITATRLAVKLQSYGMETPVAGILQCQTLGDLLQLQPTKRGSNGPSVLDISRFHDEYSHYLDPKLANDVELIMPVLALQEALLSESLQNAGSYWSHCLFALADDIDLQRLCTAWEVTAQRHEALRTAFHVAAESPSSAATDNTFVQLIHKKPLIDWTTLPSSQSQFEVQARNRAGAVAERHQKLRYSEPPWAVTIFLCDQRSVIMLSIHHAIRDEPSLGLIMAELESVYQNSAATPQPSQPQLREAISWLHPDQKQSIQDEDYWAASLSDFGDTEDSKYWPELKLTSDDQGEGTTVHSWSSLVSYTELQRKIARIGASSVASILRVTWGCILVEYLETDKAVFGETWSFRAEVPSLVDVVGPLITVIPVPFQVKGTLRETLQKMTQLQNQGKAHARIHPRVIRRILGRSKNVSLYPAIFNFMPTSTDRKNREEYSLWNEMDDIVGLSVEHDIAFNASISDDDTLNMELVASKRCMDLEHLCDLARQIDALLHFILNHPDEPLSRRLNYMPQDLLSITPLETDNASNLALGQSPTHWVDLNASRHPDWVAAEVASSISEGEVASKKWSYSQLRASYRTVASLIMSLGISKKTIAICIDRRLDVYAVILGIICTANTYLPIAEDLPEERKLLLLEDSDVPLLFTTKSLAPSIPRTAHSYRTILVEDIDYSKPHELKPKLAHFPTDNAYLLYTSGSTGKPKGVLVSQGNLLSFIEAISQFIGSHVDMQSLQGNGKWLGMASYAFDVHLLEMFFAWRHGMTAVTAPRPLLLDNLELALQMLNVTHASFVPSLVDSAGLDPTRLPSLRYMSVGGEMITKRVIDTFSRSHVILANAYGPTEVTIGCCFRKVEPSTNARNVGFPLPYTVAHVLRFGTGEYAPRGIPGELCLTGDLVANGYYKRPDAKGFVEDFHGRRMYRTGDRVRLLADGSLEFLGRDDDQTKIRGQRIELGEVSETVKSAMGSSWRTVETASIIATHPSLARPRLVAFLALSDSNRVEYEDNPGRMEFPKAGTAEEVQGYCRAVLPSFMIPDHIIRLSSLPLATISRKVDNKRLKALFNELSAADLMSYSKMPSPTSRAPSETESEVMSVAAATLGVNRERLNVDTDLFQLGLDSLNVIKLTVKLQKKGFVGTVSSILKATTCEKIALLPRNNRESRQADANTESKDDLDLKQNFIAKIRNGYDFANVAAVRPCLPLQETLIAASLDDEGEALYVNHVILELSPEIQYEKFLRSWISTSENHEILRTCFCEFESGFVQVIMRNSTLSCTRVELTAEDDGLLELHQSQSEVASDIITNIHMTPPIRLTLARPNQNDMRAILMISIHHALYDAESFSMILDEVYARYQNYPKRKTHKPLTSLIDHISSQSQEDSQRFWKEYLKGYKSRLFPASTTGHDSPSTTKQFSPSLTQVKDIAASMSSTPALMIQALFGIALAETLETNDIVFGAILSGRTVPVEDAHTIMAPCITTIPQRVCMNSSTSLKDVIVHAQTGFVESIEYQYTALRDIHRWVKADRPLFDTLFSFTNQQAPSTWSDIWHEVESSMPSEFPLAVEVTADQVTDRITAQCDIPSAFGTLEKANSLLKRLDELAECLREGRHVTLKHSTICNRSYSDAVEPDDSIWSEDEELMKEIAAESVGFLPKDLTRETSFFAIGLDSILAIPFSKRLRQNGLQCSSADVMRYPSFRELARVIVSRRDSGNASNGSAPQLQKTVSNIDLDTYPCTPLQSSMLTQTLGSDGSLYVHHHPIQLSEEIDVAVMKRAWRALVARTEILRSSFVFSHESREWTGVVRSEIEPVWNEHNPSRSLQSVMQMICKRFVFHEESDFARPPWAVDVVGTIVVFSFHHSLYDGISLNLLFSDLSAVCKGAQIQERPAFSTVAHKISARRLKAEIFWANKLSGYRGITSSQPEDAFQEDTVSLKVTPTTLLEACKALGVTLQSVALLAFAKTLSWKLGQQDITFGQIVRGRSLPELETDDVIGPLFNTIPIRLNLGGSNLTNKHVANDIQSLSGESQAYKHASLGKVQNAWRQNIGRSDATLLDSLFVFQKRAVDSEEKPWTSIGLGDDAAPTEYATNFEFNQSETEIIVCVNSKCVRDLNAFLNVFELALLDIMERADNTLLAFLEKLPDKSVNDSPHRKVTGSTNQATPSSSSEIFDNIRDVLADISGTPIAYITTDTSIFSLGLDSLSAIQIARTGRKKGLSISVADVLQGRTAGGMSERLRSQEESVKALIPAQSNDISTPSPSLLRGSELLALLGIRDDDVQDIMHCLPGQIYHLVTWLRSGRTMGEATFTYASEETLDADRLRTAWRTLRENRPMLRTVFAAVTETPAQIILKPSAMRSDSFQFLRLPSCKSGNITQIVRQEASRHFDLFSPPVELMLIHGEESDYILLKIHHAMYDAQTIGAIINDLSALYAGHPPNNIANDSNILAKFVHSSKSSNSETYWRRTLRSCKPTFLHFPSVSGNTTCRPFFYVQRTLPNLHVLEARCQQESTTLPNLILASFARVLARSTSVSSPTFGLFQAGRSVDIDGVEKTSFPCLNVLPLMIHDAASRHMGDLVRDIANNLAARVPFEQSYLRDILEWTGHGKGALFDTYVNILWNAGQKQGDLATSETLFSPAEIGHHDDLVPTDRVPGTTAVDRMNTTMISDHNFYLDMQKCKEEDCVKFLVRCDYDVMGESDAKGFLEGLVGEIGNWDP